MHTHRHTWRSARADLCLKVNTQKQCCDLLGKKWDRLPMEMGQDSHTYHGSFLGFQWLHDTSSNSRAHSQAPKMLWLIHKDSLLVFLLIQFPLYDFSGEVWTNIYSPQTEHWQQTKEMITTKSRLVNHWVYGGNLKNTGQLKSSCIAKWPIEA